MPRSSTTPWRRPTPKRRGCSALDLRATAAGAARSYDGAASGPKPRRAGARSHAAALVLVALLGDDDGLVLALGAVERGFAGAEVDLRVRRAAAPQVEERAAIRLALE